MEIQNTEKHTLRKYKTGKWQRFRNFSHVLCLTAFLLLLICTVHPVKADADAQKTARTSAVQTKFARKSGRIYYYKGKTLQNHYTGFLNYRGKTLYFVKGIYDGSITGFVRGRKGPSRSITWAYVKKSIVQDGRAGSSFTGIKSNKAGTWYVNNGWLDRSQNGIISYGGVLFRVKNGKTTRKKIFIGDSRTVRMFKALHGGKGQEVFAISDNEIWSAYCNKGYKWVKSRGIPRIEKYIDDVTDVIVLSGVNDILKHSALSDFTDYINRKAAKWNQKGAQVFYCSVGPVAKEGHKKMPGQLQIRW